MMGWNISTWQLDNGGWGKVGYQKYMNPWDGVENRSVYICNHASCEKNEPSTLDNQWLPPQLSAALGRFGRANSNSSGGEEISIPIFL